MNAPIETIRIGSIASCAERLEAIKTIIRAQEKAGWFDVLRMDDDVAVVRYRDPKITMLFCEPVGVA